MIVRLTTAAGLAFLLAGGFLVAEGCSSFSEADSSAADAGPDVATFCSTQPDAGFCTDFETLPLDAGFSELFVTEGALALTDEGAPASPLHAFQATAPAVTGTPPASATIGMDDAGPIYGQAATMAHPFTGSQLGRLVFDADLRIDDLPPVEVAGMYSTFVLTGTAQDQPDHNVRVAFGRDAEVDGAIAGVLAAGVGDADTYATFKMSKGLGQWFHMRVTIDREAGRVSIAIDDDAAGVLSPTPVLQGRSFFKLGVGLVRLRGNANTAVTFDNIVLNTP